MSKLLALFYFRLNSELIPKIEKPLRGRAEQGDRGKEKPYNIIFMNPKNL